MTALAVLLLGLGVTAASPPDPSGHWRAALDLAGGPLRFALELEPTADGWAATLCNGTACSDAGPARLEGDSLIVQLVDFDARIAARIRGDSLSGMYSNVGNRGPRVIPFRASRGTWPVSALSAGLAGQWDATLVTDGRTSPRIFIFEQGPAGPRGAVVSNTGDYGEFGGIASGDSVVLSHFDGSFVYMITAALSGDTLRGTFHAGLRTQTPFTAVRSSGTAHLREPTAMTAADTTERFRFAFPDLAGNLVTSDDPRFAGKVVLVDVFGTWCSTCHYAAPILAGFQREYGPRGLAIVGLAYEVTGDTAIDGALVRRYRDKFQLPFPLLLAGVGIAELAAETLPQLRGFTAFPTTIFLGRDGRVRRVHAGFYGPATGAMHQRQVAEFRSLIEELLAEVAPPEASPPQ
ncbi:MAG TPA: TlpA disulfide reductase family protein [Gemmatimonadales bacterium]|nr:TlpA disulfide reductase family protein [Gemmatimonadales bacterium]